MRSLINSRFSDVYKKIDERPDFFPVVEKSEEFSIEIDMKQAITRYSRQWLAANTISDFENLTEQSKKRKNAYLPRRCSPILTTSPAPMVIRRSPLVQFSRR